MAARPRQKRRLAISCSARDCPNGADAWSVQVVGLVGTQAVGEFRFRNVVHGSVCLSGPCGSELLLPRQSKVERYCRETTYAADPPMKGPVDDAVLAGCILLVAIRHGRRRQQAQPC